MTQMGYAKAEPESCPHLNNWGMEVHGDYLFRTCFTCGRSWILVALEEGVAWEDVAEPEETRDVVGVGKAVLAMSKDKADEPVQRKPRKSRRSRPPVQDLPRPVELQPATEDGTEAVSRVEET